MLLSLSLLSDIFRAFFKTNLSFYYPFNVAPDVEDVEASSNTATEGTMFTGGLTGVGWNMQLRAIASHPSVVQFYKTYTATNTYSIEVSKATFTLSKSEHECEIQ